MNKYGQNVKIDYKRKNVSFHSPSKREKKDIQLHLSHNTGRIATIHICIRKCKFDYKTDC